MHHDAGPAAAQRFLLPAGPKGGRPRLADLSDPECKSAIDALARGHGWIRAAAIVTDIRVQAVGGVDDPKILRDLKVSVRWLHRQLRARGYDVELLGRCKSRRLHSLRGETGRCEWCGRPLDVILQQPELVMA